MVRASKYFEMIIRMTMQNHVPEKHESHSFEHEMEGQETYGSDNMVDLL